MGTYALWNKTVRYYGQSDMKHVLDTTSFNSTDDIILFSSAFGLQRVKILWYNF